MTQMLLFDAPLVAAPLGSASVAVAEVPCAPVPATPVGGKPVKSITSALQGAVGESEQLAGDAGLHHMGDLARLVLLRYELMAKRREQMAAAKLGSAKLGLA